MGAVDVDVDDDEDEAEGRIRGGQVRGLRVCTTSGCERVL